MPPFAARSVFVMLLVVIGASIAVAQTRGPTSGSDIAGFTCSDISLLPVANQAALIYYIAGYRDGVAASVGTPAAPSEEARQQAPVLNLDARRIIVACAGASASRIADLIAEDDGGTGMGTLDASLGLYPSSSSMETRVIVLRETRDTTATDAVSANLSAASEALQDSINRPPFVAPPLP